MQSTTSHGNHKELSVIVPAVNLISDIHDCLTALNLLREDIDLVESVQRGLSSSGYVPGPLVIDPKNGVNSELD